MTTASPGRVKVVMPWWKKSTVASTSAAVNPRRLAGPVVPEVHRLTMCAISDRGEHTKGR
jgi:hypothetical protein